NATHRMAGKLWMAGGMLIMLAGLFDEEIMVFFLITAVFMMAFIPMIYSYIFYRREKAEGKDVTTSRALPLTPAMLKMRKFSMVGIAAVLVFVVVIMFAGDIEYEMNDESFEIKADFYEDLTVRYDFIENIEYVEDFRTGIRTMGFGSARLSMGQFANDELGKYTLYAYTGADSHIVMENNGKYLVISAKTVEETQALYENLLERTGK
ncbi:MAG: SdpI family protein, partial [Clostridia bacterium]|nr:SdpI family protein [Clostridia bacterium]